MKDKCLYLNSKYFPYIFLLWGTNITNVSSLLSIISPPTFLPLYSHIYHCQQNPSLVVYVFLDVPIAVYQVKAMYESQGLAFFCISYWYLLLGITTKTTERYFLLISPCSCTLLIFKLPNFQALMQVFVSQLTYKRIYPCSYWEGSQTIFLLR